MDKHNFQRVGYTMAAVREIELDDKSNNGNVANETNNNINTNTFASNTVNITPDDLHYERGIQRSKPINYSIPQESVTVIKKNKKNEADLSKVLSIKAEKIRHRILEEMKAESAMEDDGNSLSLNLEDGSRSIHHPIITCPISENKVIDQASRIPVSQARMKRREKQKMHLDIKVKTQNARQISSTQSKIDIRKYRPGYTWNKGGRVKELRLRCLARKFAYIWRRRTFGRIPLSVAENHYEESLKKKIFAAWYDFWWEIVKEWRLGVRAECHLRHKICLHVFIAWRQYIRLRRIKKVKSQSAYLRHNETVLHRAWQGWLAYIKMKHAQQPLQVKANSFREATLTKLAWYEWRRRYFIRESQKESWNLALQFSSYRMQAEHWLIWKSAFRVRQQIEVQHKNASVYHNSVIGGKCLRAWKLYTDNRKVKKAHYAFAERNYCIQVKSRSFVHWFQRWHLIKSLQQHQNQMESLARSSRLRWVMWRWNMYVDSCNADKEKETMAQQHYDFYLMRLGFDSFRLNIVHCQIKVMRNQLSDQLAASQLTKRTWRRWMDHLEHKEELRLASVTDTAHHHYSLNLLFKCFTSLADYTKWRKLRKIHYAQADAHFFLHAVPKCLFHMKINVEVEKTCRENAIESQNFYRSTTLQKSFRIWYATSIKSRDERMMHRMAILHNESISLRNAFSVWRQRTLEEEMERENMWQAERHYMYSLFHKYFDAWQCYIDGKRTSALKERQAAIHYYCSTARNALTQWKKWIHHKAQMRLKAEMAEKHFAKKSLTSCMRKWKEVRAQGQMFKSIAEEKYLQYQKILLKKSLCDWQKNASEKAAKKRKQAVASFNYNRILLSKTMVEWHRYAAVRAYKHCQTQELLSNAISQLEKLRLAQCWKRWMQEKIRAKAIEDENNRASDHHHQLVMQKTFECWKMFTRGCLRKRLLSRQCQWFHDIRLSAKHFLTWQERLVEKREENEKSQLALWHWSLSLQRKVLYAWISYKDHQRHKKQRLIEASSVRRERLLRSACCQWLRTSDSLYQVRSSLAARYQTKAVMDSFLLVQKCAFHWRSWARRRRALVKTRSKTRENPYSVPLIAKGRAEYKPSEVLAIPTVLPSQMVRSACSIRVDDDLKPQPSVMSPLRQGVSLSNASKIDLRPKQRPLPTRPSFLVDSLQRAGLYSQMFSEGPADVKPNDIEESDRNSSLADDPHIQTSPDRPGTSRFDLHDMPTSQRSRTSAWDTGTKQDSSLSAEVLSGSNSTMGPTSSALRPLHLSNTDTDGTSTRTTSSHSPRMFTPTSTQRSQFSGNPLLYSSPISDSDINKPSAVIDNGGENIMALNGHGIESFVVRGNLDGGDNAVYHIHHPLSNKEPHPPHVIQEISTQSSNEGIKMKKRLQLQPKESNIFDDTSVIWKPEDFMKKPSNDGKPRRHSSEGSLGAFVKQTPRAFATWELEKLSEYTEQEGQAVKNSDSAREGKGVLRHTPREMFSPRRITPQGILHKVSDSDGDVSPLNTARSRGTVTFASPKSPTPEEEIMNIRDRLKHFAQQKRKLKSLQKQYRQLSDWLEAEDDKQSDDDDSRNASEELDMIRLEVAQLQAFVDGQKPICERLVLRAQGLVAELTIPLE